MARQVKEVRMPFRYSLFIKDIGRSSIRVAIFLLLLRFISSLSLADEGSAYEHICEVMDKYHEALDVYTDVSAAGNHFVNLGSMPSSAGEDSVAIDPSSTVSPYSGYSCITNAFIASGDNWGGWYFMNGVLEGDEVEPKPNWGDYPDAGIDLTRATQLTFWARGENGGERVEFFAFGVGRDAVTGIPTEQYPDSSPKVSLDYVTLSNSWTRYTMDLGGSDLSYVLGGFGWVTNAPQNNNQDIVFYLDDIRYDQSRLDEPRFLVSYETVPSSTDFDMVLKNVAFTYDNVLALLAFLARGTTADMERAQLIVDALVYAINNDRYFTDGRLRNAYQGGDLTLPPGWRPNGRSDTVRMPGWMDPNDFAWHENGGHVGTHTGNMAWAIIGLLSYYEQAGRSQYLDAAKVLAEWIQAETRDARGAGGYTGGYDGWEPTSNNPGGQTKLLWKSTENNIDVYVAFTRLYRATGDATWQARAAHARQFVEAMWNDTGEHFWTGTTEDGVTINEDNIPLDIQAWAIMAFDSYNSAVHWAESNCYTEADGFQGFDFNNDTDGIWFEGTAHMAIAYQINEDMSKSQACLEALRKAQATGTNANGKGLIAASHDGVTTGFGWDYHSRLHVGATAWYIFAEMRYNPYWGTMTILVGDFCAPNFGPPDGYVDVWDLMQFADHWHTRTGEGNWDSRFDLAGPNFAEPDGYIDVWDLMTFADHWHEGEKP